MTEEPTMLGQGKRLHRGVWLTGGILLVLWAVGNYFDLAPLLTVPGGEWSLRVIFAAATFAFALGWKGVGSVTGRRPVGTTALILVGLWPFFTEFADSFLWDDSNYVLWSVVSELLRLGVAVVAVTQIVRAGLVVKPWAWTPAVGLAVYVLAQAGAVLMAMQLGLLESPYEQSYADIQAYLAVLELVGLIQSCAVAGIGAVAIVLASGTDTVTPRAPSAVATVTE